MNTGSSNRLIYDKCAYDKNLSESVAPLNYRMYSGAHENCNKCVHDKIYRPFDLVDQESELKNITRLSTKCPEFKYNPNCKKQKGCKKHCHTTFDNNNPIVLAPEVCPIVFNNIEKPTDVGYTMPNQDIC
jgi:hypothetical protein